MDDLKKHLNDLPDEMLAVMHTLLVYLCTRWRPQSVFPAWLCREGAAVGLTGS